MKFCIIVDGYSTARSYAECFKRAGYECLHIQSDGKLLKTFTGCFCPSPYKSVMIHENFTETISWITHQCKDGQLNFIIPGIDTGVMLADQLSEHFGLATSNGTEKSKLRTDKYEMGEAVHNSGLRSIRGCKARSSTEAFFWLKQEGVAFPVIIKPVDSAGGDGFNFCTTPQDVETAFRDNLHQTNVLAKKNTSLLVQEYIRGDEYVVDTVSVNGIHVVTDFLKYEKRITERGHSVYQSCTFLPRQYEGVEKLTQYAFGILNVLGIKHGPAHIEIMVDENGPVLIELGARPAGCRLDQELVMGIYGHSQIQLSVLSYVNPKLFLESVPKLSTELTCHLELIFLACQNSGVIDDINSEPILKLETFKKMDLLVEKGQEICIADDLLHSVAIVYLQSCSQEEIDRDKAFLRKFESDFLQISSSRCLSSKL